MPRCEAEFCARSLRTNQIGYRLVRFFWGPINRDHFIVYGSLLVVCSVEAVIWRPSPWCVLGGGIVGGISGGVGGFIGMIVTRSVIRTFRFFHRVVHGRFSSREDLTGTIRSEVESGELSEELPSSGVNSGGAVRLVHP